MPWKGAQIVIKRKHCHTFVRQFLRLLAMQMSQAGDTITMITGLGAAVSPAATTPRINGAVGSISTGTVVGTGSNPVLISDYSLQTIINNGVGAGQLQYAIQTFLAQYEIGASRYFPTERVFTNASGASITVNEIGLYSTPAGAAPTFMLSRDLLSFAIPNGQTRTVRYVIYTTTA